MPPGCPASLRTSSSCMIILTALILTGLLWNECTAVSNDKCDWFEHVFQHKPAKMFQEPELKEWEDRYETGRTPWHVTEVNHELTDNSNHLFFDGERNYKVFVPMCGKATDMKWLYDKGCTVHGVEFVEKALVDFMKENNLTYTTRKIGDVKVFESTDKRVVLYCCDIFKFSKLVGEKDFDIIYDIGSFAFGLGEKNEDYAALMNSVVAPNFRYLLVWDLFPPTGHSHHGEPFSLADLDSVFGKYFAIKTLSTKFFDNPASVHHGSTTYVSLLSPK